MNEQTTISAVNKNELILENYISILEKTNQQLSLWSNPYGIMIGILTVILAFVAIIVSIYLWKNSKEQRDLFKKTIIKSQQNLEKQASVLIEQKSIEIDAIISGFEKMKDSVIGEKKQEFQNLIDEQKKKKIKNDKDPVGVFYENDSVLNGIFSFKSTICTNCGTEFKYKHDINELSLISIYNKVYCSHCGAINYI